MAPGFTMIFGASLGSFGNNLTGTGFPTTLYVALPLLRYIIGFVAVVVEVELITVVEELGLLLAVII